MAGAAHAEAAAHGHAATGPFLSPPKLTITGPRPGRPTRYCWTDCIVASTLAMLVGDVLELLEVVVVVVDGLEFAWMAVSTAA